MKGRYFFPNGNLYDGEFVEGRFDGFGMYKWPDGENYTGEWKKDKRHG